MLTSPHERRYWRKEGSREESRRDVEGWDPSDAVCSPVEQFLTIERVAEISNLLWGARYLMSIVCICVDERQEAEDCCLNRLLSLDLGECRSKDSMLIRGYNVESLLD